MKKIFLTSFIAVAGLMSSCSESFFELTPDDAVTTDKVYKTESDYKLALNGCYSKMQTQMDFYTELCEWRSDNLDLKAPTAGTQDRYNINKFCEAASNGIIDGIFANFNNGVYRCNMLLDRIDGATFDETKKAQYKGEALFIRSYTWFNMYRIWGPVVLADHVVTVNESLKMGRATEQEMYDAITGDLEQIVNNKMLPESYANADKGRVTLGAAKALLAKVYLTFKQPAKAVAVLETLIGKYSLQSNILDVFDVTKKNNPEIIFTISYNKTLPGEGHGAWYSLGNLNNETNQTEALLGSFYEGDKRKAAIEYVQLPGIKVCLMRKLYDTPDATTTQYGSDYIILRYADVLLMYAEALNEVGYSNSQSSPAMKALNEVHVRAGLTPLDISNFKNQAEFRKAILRERQAEFPYEGHRWFDAVRMGAIAEIAANKGININDYQARFPYPSTELQRINDTSLVWQNPGY